MWLPVGLAVIVLLVVAVTIGGAFMGFKYGFPALVDAIDRRLDPAWRQFAKELAQLRADIDAIPKSFEEYQAEVKRLHDRAYHRVRRARAELAERGVADPEVDQVAGELQQFDGEGGLPGQLSLLPEDMAVGQTSSPTQQPMTQQPLTWQQRTARYKRGY